MKQRYRMLITVILALVLLAPLSVQAQGPANEAESGVSITLHAAGRGNPWINILDAGDLPTTYAGQASLSARLEAGAAKPLSLASADFDEDGVPDLVSGYAVNRNLVFDKNQVSNGGGILTLHRGNVDAIWPNTPEAQKRKDAGTFVDAPFFPQARVFELPAAPAFLGAGDFDADGHWDVVAAALGGESLMLLPGDGQGGFRPAEAVKLPGGVTALAVGEINRRDGLDDVVVGVIGKQGPQVLVFEGPEGALHSQSEIIDVAAKVAGLALGALDEDGLIDMAVAAGDSLLIIHGRDRKLYGDKGEQFDAVPPKMAETGLSFSARAVALGDFVPEEGYRLEIALLADDGGVHLLQRPEVTGQKTMSGAEKWTTAASVSGAQFDAGPMLSPAPQLVVARLSNLPTEDLLILDPAGQQVHILTTVQKQAPADPTPPASLRLAPWSTTLDVSHAPAAVLPMRLNIDAFSDLAILTDGGVVLGMTAPLGTWTVNSTSDEPDGLLGDGTCSGCVTIEEGQCVPNNICSFLGALSEANYKPGSDLIYFNLAPGDNTIRGDYFDNFVSGLDGGVTIDGGGAVMLSGDTDDDGTADEYGLVLGSDNNTIRGLAINCGYSSNLSLNGDNNIVEGNFIGTNLSGTEGLWCDYSDNGIRVFGNDNIIGGTASAARNLISSVKSGINIFNDTDSPASDNQVMGNHIGTDLAGENPLDNNVGVNIEGGTSNTIGGSAPGAGNLISGNELPGVRIQRESVNNRPSPQNLVVGNYIGTNAAGSAALGNGTFGVRLRDSDNTVRNNVISGNTLSGIRVESDGHLIEGNRVGLNGSADGAIPNATGVEIFFDNNNTIQDNVISGNSEHGLVIDSDDNTVQDNLIGTLPDGETGLPNGGDGIRIIAGNNNLIGGTEAGEGNTIASNNGYGVLVLNSLLPGPVIVPATNNRLLGNAIFHNVEAAINLCEDGDPYDCYDEDALTQNDLFDEDGGNNNLQNFPELTSLTVEGGNTIIQGGLNSARNTTYRIEFFSSDMCRLSGAGDAKTYLGSTDVTTDNEAGHADFTFTYPGTPPESVITATATDPDGNTSEIFPGIFQEAGGLSLQSATALYGACAAGPVFTVENDGGVFADGTYQTPAADFAEMWPVGTEGGEWRLEGGRALEPGDVLALGPDGGVVLAGLRGAGPVIGIYSTQPGLLAGGPQPVSRITHHASRSRVPVALVGIVPIKVSVENDPIRPGDLLALSSTPGVAARAKPVSFGEWQFYLSGSFLGKALEPFNGPGQGMVRVLLIGQGQ